MFKRHRNKLQQRFEPIDNELTTKGIYGLEICHDNDQAVADIVFVHGLTGNRRSTWTDKHTKIFWPKDLLGSDQLPPTRILSYGYDADVAHFWALASQNRIGEHARNLVNALAQLRDRSDTERRPIIFVAHSLGGLVTEDAILHSRNSAESYLQDIFRSVAGICFLGTPHCGSDLARWASVATSLASAVKTANKSLVRTLTLNSEVLARIEGEFQNMHRTLPRETAFGITCFFEEIPVRGIGDIVPKHSAILPSYNAIGIHANHMEMSKYDSIHNPGYGAVSGEIRRWLKAIKNRRDAEKMVSNAPIPVDDWSTPTRRPYTEQTAPIAREHSQPNMNTFSDDTTPNYVSHKLSHHAEPIQLYLHPPASSHRSNHLSNPATQAHTYGYPEARSQSFNPPEPPRSYSRTPVEEQTRNYTPLEPPRSYSHTPMQEQTRTSTPSTPTNPYRSNSYPYDQAQHYASAHMGYQTQNNALNEPSYPYPKTSPPSYTQSSSSFAPEQRQPHYDLSNAFAESKYENGSVGPVFGGVGIRYGDHHHHHNGTPFQNIRNSGSGPQLMGSFNVGGNMNFG
ncbi:hypothetical protein E8E12_003674 [Didymella heteroderae]|uniref:DUF676 domain-containing protein n=1 Tax=Didymella heteroderae TaxID=1769908 RepID=A0A9P4WRL7_9PLEO|nr:hypothetical protein E8E12_003674 [Didymella heteroderae]